MWAAPDGRWRNVNILGVLAVSVKLLWLGLYYPVMTETSGCLAAALPWLLAGVFGSVWLAGAGVSLLLLGTALWGYSAATFNMSIAALFAVGLALRFAGRLVDPVLPNSPLFLRHTGAFRRLFWAAELLLAGWLLLRSSPLPLGAALLALTLLLHWSLPFPPVAVRLRVLAANAVLVLLSLLFSVAMMEGVARIAYGAPAPAGGLFRPHPVYQYLLNPGARVTYSVATAPGATTGIQYSISTQGLRDREFPPKGEDERRVLLLGDSFTMGHAVAEEHMISRQLEALLARRHPDKNITVINGGMNAAGPLQELGMLRERGLPLSPDSVILQLFLPNDIDDCLAVVGKAQRVFVEAGRRLFDALRHRQSGPERLELWARGHSAAYRALLRATGFKTWVVDILRAFRFVPADRTPPLRPLEPDLYLALDVNRVEWYPELEEGLLLLAGHVEEMAAACRETGADFAVWCMPDSAEIDAERWDGMVRIAPEGTGPFAPGTAIRRVRELLAGRGIRTFSVEEALRGSGLSAGELYYLEDGHPTPEGNRVIAGALADFLMQDPAARP